MNFKSWLEALDVLNEPTHDINLKKAGNNYQYEFEIAGKNFRVEFDKLTYKLSPEGAIIPNWSLSPSNGFSFPVWNIIFSGPDLYYLTRLGKNMFIIYKQLLLAIKKLMEVENVVGFNFHGAESAMESVYLSFYKKYLANDFVWYNNSPKKNPNAELLIHRDLFKKIYQQHPEKQQFVNTLKNSQRGKFAYVDKIKQDKIAQRKPNFAPNIQ